MPFQQYGSGAKLSASTSSSSAAIPINGNALRVVNVGTVAAFVKTGVDAATATISNGVPVGPNEGTVLYKDPMHNFVAVITDTGTSTVYVASGAA